MRNPFRYFNSSPEIIRLTVMMYIRYPLSLRQVEDILFERGIDICHETVRLWWNRFGPMFAAEICETVTRPSMRFVPVKSSERQGVLMLHRMRDLLMRQRTMMLNAARAHLAEFGIITAQGPHKIVSLIRAIEAGDGPNLPSMARAALDSLTTQLDTLTGEIGSLERQLLAWHRADEASRRLATIPGIGIITATALAASVPDPSVFRTGREFAAFLGLVPRQNSSGGKDRLGRISKMGDGYLRWLLVVGATSVVRRAGGKVPIARALSPLLVTTSVGL